MEIIMPKKKIDFESALKRIIDISDKLENEEMKLEDAMKLYKEAVNLIHNCEQFVDKAERQIYIYREGQEDITETEDDEDIESDDNEDETNSKSKGKKTKKKNKADKSKKKDESFELFTDIEKLSE